MTTIYLEIFIDNIFGGTCSALSLHAGLSAACWSSYRVRRNEIQILAVKLIAQRMSGACGRVRGAVGPDILLLVWYDTAKIG